MGLYASFIAMTALNDELGDNQSHRRRGATFGARIGGVLCTCLAASIHFFTLSSIAWMGVEGAIVYLLFVKVFYTHVHLFVLKAAVFALGKL